MLSQNWTSVKLSDESSDFHGGSHVVELVAGTGSISPSSTIYSASCILSVVLSDICKNATFQKGRR